MSKLSVILIMLSVCVSGCSQVRTEPRYPKDVPGWKDYEVHGVKLRGSFVLHKGESTDNGKVRVKVADLLAPERVIDHGGFSAQARAVLQFVRISDQKILCDKTWPEHGGVSLDGCDGLSSDFQISDVGIGDINLKDGWVYFNLYGSY